MRCCASGGWVGRICFSVATTMLVKALPKEFSDATKAKKLVREKAFRDNKRGDCNPRA
jgi:hypothetical protein